MQGTVSYPPTFFTVILNFYFDSSIEMWYLHAPDRTTPFEDTMRTVNELHKEGKFKRFGISNYTAYVSSSSCFFSCLRCVGSKSPLTSRSCLTFG